MSDPGDIERRGEEDEGPSRRDVLWLGMLALSATQLPAVTARAQGVKPGAHLIGKLEGPEVVTDPAQVPKRFNEAPQLAELVKAGREWEEETALPTRRRRVPLDDELD